MYDTNFDGQRLMCHPREVAEWLLRGATRGPLYTEMELTKRCNCRCLFCGVDYEVNASREALEAGLGRRAVEELAGMGNQAVLFSGSGEPLLHPQAAEIVAYSAARMNTALATNGVALTGDRLALIDGLAWIRFSVNGGSPQSYATVQGTASEWFERVLANIAAAVRRKRDRSLRVTIGVQLVLLDANADTTLELGRRVRELGVDYFTVKPFSAHPLGSKRLQVDYGRFNELARDLKALETGNFRVIYRARSMAKLNQPKPYGQCYGTHFVSLISANGDVWECNVFAGDARFLIGNVAQQSLEDIWNGPRRREVLEFIAHDLNLAECRDVCRMDECNRYLWRLKHPWEHDNFI